MMAFMKILGEYKHLCPPSSTFEGDRPGLSPAKFPPLVSVFP